MFCGTAAAALPLCFAALPLRHCRYMFCGTAAAALPLYIYIYEML
jgi:hypothetical protein